MNDLAGRFQSMLERYVQNSVCSDSSEKITIQHNLFDYSVELKYSAFGVEETQRIPFHVDPTFSVYQLVDLARNLRQKAGRKLANMNPPIALDPCSFGGCI